MAQHKVWLAIAKVITTTVITIGISISASGQTPAAYNTSIKYQLDTAYVTGKTNTGTNPVRHTAENAVLKRMADYILYNHIWDSTNFGSTSGTVTSITYTAPLTGGTITTTGTVGIPAATAGQAGYLTTTDYATFNNKQEVFTPTSVKTTSYVAVPKDFVICNTTSGPLTITLPTAPTTGTRIGAKMVIQAGTNAVTITAGGSDVFNKTGGSTSITLALVNQSVVLQYLGSAGIWYVVAEGNTLAALDTRFAAQNLTYALATDANYTVPGTHMFIELPVTTAPRNIVMPTATAGAKITVCNLSANAGDWTFTGVAVQNPDGTTIGALNVTTSYDLIANGTVWRRIL